MLQFDQVQTTIVTQLRAAPYLAGLLVEEDMGSQLSASAVAQALDQRGVAIIVYPPSRSALVQCSAAKLVMDVEAELFIEVNPETNKGEQAKNILLLVKESVKAVLAYRGEVQNPNDLFSLAETEPITLDTFDAGLLRYHIVFSKRCVL